MGNGGVEVRSECRKEMTPGWVLAGSQADFHGMARRSSCIAQRGLWMIALSQVGAGVVRLSIRVMAAGDIALPFMKSGT